MLLFFLCLSIVSAQPCAHIAPGPNGGYINPVYALAIQNEYNDNGSPIDADTAAAAPVDTVSDGIIGGSVSGGTPGGSAAGVPPDGGTVAGLAATDVQVITGSVVDLLVDMLLQS